MEISVTAKDMSVQSQQISVLRKELCSKTTESEDFQRRLDIAKDDNAEKMHKMREENKFLVTKRETEKKQLMAQTRFLTDKSIEYDRLREAFKSTEIACVELQNLLKRNGIEYIPSTNKQSLSSRNASLAEAQLQIRELSAEKTRLENEIEIAYWTEPETSCPCAGFHGELREMLKILQKLHMHD